jgi:hypothetical protein
LGNTEFGDGGHTTAREYFATRRRALELFAEGHDWRGQAITLPWLAQSSSAVGDHRSAPTHLARSRTLPRRSHVPSIEAELLNAAAPVLARLGRPPRPLSGRRRTTCANQPAPDAGQPPGPTWNTAIPSLARPSLANSPTMLCCGPRWNWGTTSL